MASLLHPTGISQEFAFCYKELFLSTMLISNVFPYNGADWLRFEAKPFLGSLSHLLLTSSKHQVQDTVFGGNDPARMAPLFFLQNKEVFGSVGLVDGRGWSSPLSLVNLQQYLHSDGSFRILFTMDAQRMGEVDAVKLNAYSPIMISGSDVVLRAEDSELVVSREVLLSSGSNYFVTMLSNRGFIEHEQGVITLNGFYADELLLLMDFIHSVDRPSFLTKDNVKCLLFLGSYCQFDSLIHLCEGFLENCETMDIVKKLVMCRNNNLSELEHRLLKSFRERADLPSKIFLVGNVEYCLLGNLNLDMLCDVFAYFKRPQLDVYSISSKVLREIISKYFPTAPLNYFTILLDFEEGRRQNNRIFSIFTKVWYNQCGSLVRCSGKDYEIRKVFISRSYHILYQCDVLELKESDNIEVTDLADYLHNIPIERQGSHALWLTFRNKKWKMAEQFVELLQKVGLFAGVRFRYWNTELGLFSITNFMTKERMKLVDSACNQEELDNFFTVRTLRRFPISSAKESQYKCWESPSHYNLKH
uniref:BTB domain-containing protein n=1 Tax=Ditylenchus dipsaci TaxID=166011 RepID=A0A915DXL3_9BILA